MKITKKGFSGRIATHEGHVRLLPTPDSLHLLQHMTFKEGSALFVAIIQGLQEGGYSVRAGSQAEFVPNPMGFLSGHD